MQRYLMNTSYLQDSLRRLHALHKDAIADYGELVRNLNEECDILCDVIPAYKISSTLAAEDGGNAQRKKKEVYNVQRLEHEVLTQYEHFLQLLRRLARKPHPEQQALGSRLCAKLVSASSASEYNHADVLLTLAVHFANSKSTRVAQPALTALTTLLDGQVVTDASESVVAALLDVVRKRDYAVNPRLLTLLLHIRVAMVDVHRRDVTEEAAKNKRLKKQDKELARQMQKANARRDRAELAARQSRLLHRVFVIYLRILDAARGCAAAHQAKILAPTLEGLVKFAPLINVELHQQLLQALKDIVQQPDTATPIATKLHALVAVATLAQRDATATSADWRVDLSYFHEELYRCLPAALQLPDLSTSSHKTTRHDGGDDNDNDDDGNDNDDAASSASSAALSVGSASSLSSQAFSIANSMAAHGQASTQANACRAWSFQVGLVLRAVDLLVLSQKHLPLVRVTALLRRLLLCATQCPAHAAMALLALCHRLLLRYPLAAGVVMGGSDHVLTGRGAYNPAASQTAAANADGSFTWELGLLARSYHPTLRQVSEAFARHYLKLSKHVHGQAPVTSRQLDALGPYEVMAEYDTSSGECKPAPPLPRALRTATATTEKTTTRKRARDADNEEA